MNPEECILFSGAAPGAEAAFGEAAEKAGVTEVNFTFEGHKDARTRGIRVLTPVELDRGSVSLRYGRIYLHDLEDRCREYEALLGAENIAAAYSGPSV